MKFIFIDVGSNPNIAIIKTVINLPCTEPSLRPCTANRTYNSGYSPAKVIEIYPSLDLHSCT